MILYRYKDNSIQGLSSGLFTFYRICSIENSIKVVSMLDFGAGDNKSQDNLHVACKDSVAILLMFDLTSRCTLNRCVSFST